MSVSFIYEWNAKQKVFSLTTLDMEGVGGVGGADDGGEDVGALSNNSAFGSIDMILFILLLAFSGLPE
jgi:hypothetical protein